MQYATLTIRTVIMHQIMPGAARGVGPQLSDIPTDMPEADRAFIQERIRKALPKDARPITEDVGLSHVPDLIRTHLQLSDSDAISISQDLAKQLQAAQHPVSPGGIFVFADATLDQKPALLLAKLEHHEGVRATPTILDDGHVTFGIELLKDLLFTTGSKVFKVALFVVDDISDGRLNGVLVDRQMAGSSVAVFFLTTFLGCRLAEKADLLTERFYSGTQSYISSIPDPEKQARYEVALLGELQSQKPNLSVLDFASNHLDVEDRDAFTHSLQGSGVPQRTFDKNIGLIKARIAKVKLNTEQGVTVLAPREAIDNGTVTVNGQVNEQAIITVRDRLTAFR